jgi:2-oxo-4-hydroxy-4-carboxy-5-ureidoimidazoline decarboxylase
MEPWHLLNEAAPERARELLRGCCGSERWVGRMAARRPFPGIDDLLTAARDEWLALAEQDWLEAFRHHPKIGDRESLRRRFPATHHLSSREQAGVDGAGGDVLDALAAKNEAYERKFGFIFIVCATGRNAAGMLALLEARLGNDRATELQNAASEQAKITELRLRSLGS